MKFMEFAETLENKIREDLFGDGKSQDVSTANSSGPSSWFFESARTVDTDPTCLSFLLGQIPVQGHRHGNTQGNTDEKTTSHITKTPYAKLIQPRRPKPDHIFTNAQRTAYETFVKLGSDLKANFSRQELKKAFRTMALRHHPDQGGKANEFMLVKQSAETLTTVFKI